MFAKTRKETFVSQAQDLANDLTEAITPHLEKARDELGPRLADARDPLAPHVEDARAAASPYVKDARDAVTPYLEEARDKIVNDLVPAVKQAASDAKDAAAPIADEALRRGDLAAAALKGDDVQRKSGKKKWFVIAALAGGAAYAWTKLRGGNESANWQSSYTPAPAPTPAAPPTPATPSAPQAGAHVADDSIDGVDDATGATPGEALADSVEEPHTVSTPDSPSETVDVSEIKDPPAKS
jgi:hypothetical protein